MTFWRRLVDLCFGCPHSRTTFPLTAKSPKRTYVVCLECGKEFEYDWKEMRVGESSRAFLVEQSEAGAVPLTGTGEVPRT